MIKTHVDGYVLEVPFPYHDYSLPYKKDMIAQFHQKRKVNRHLKNSTQVYNFHYINPEFNKFIVDKFISILLKLFVLSPPCFVIRPMIYAQTNIDSDNHWHTHQQSKIASVYYIDPPKGDGNIEFLYDNVEYEIETKKDMLYIFPSWMDHRPLIQKSETQRVAVNMDYYTDGKVKSIVSGRSW